MSSRICYQMSEPEMEFHMIDIIHVALPMRAQTEKTTFSCKDDGAKSLHVYWSWAKGLVKIKTVPGPSLHNLSCACFNKSN